MAPNLSHDLSQFLASAGRRGFCWGRHDCMLFAADWALALSGRDPAARWRGTYSDEAGATAIVEAAGGWIAIVQDALQAIGWKSAPIGLAAGDIVLVAPPPHYTVPVSGIATGGTRVALLTRQGLVVWPLTPFYAWRFHG